MTELPITERSSDCGCDEAHSEGPELDARQIPHRIRHAAVLGVVGSLGLGQSFVLVAPHDPLPLLAQIRKQTDDQIEVSYLQRGPEAWRLQLTRR